MNEQNIIAEIKLLLGDVAQNYTDAQISLAYKMSLAEVQEYCKREADITLLLIAERISVIKLLRMGTEGLASQSFSGVSESYIADYPDDIKAVLNRKRKMVIL